MKDTAGVLNWARCNLEDVCRLVNGRAYKRPELLDAGKYRVLRVGNLFTNGSWFWSDLELDEDKYIDKGDLIYAWSASFGPRIWDGEKVIYHYHIWKCLPDPALLDKHFLYRWFEWDTAKVKADHGTGSTMIHVTKGDMEARPLGLPPLPEQRRIVAKLDRLSARTKAARAHLARVQSLATRAKQATLAAAFRDLEERTTLGEIAVDVRYGTAKKCDYEGEGVPVLRIPNVANGRIDLTDLKRADFDAKELRKLALDAGDILIIRSNGSLALVGRSAVVEPEHAGLLFAGYLIRVRLDPARASARFVQLVLASSETRRIIEGYAKSTSGVNNVNSSQLSSLPIPALPIEQQHKLVRRVEAAFARIDRMVEEATRAAHLLDRLDQRLLAKAFRGELVPQDPTDEPADQLLARIQAARAAAPKPQRGRRTRA